MSYETLKTKKFISDDKILFKRGDIFQGRLKVRQTIVDNKALTLSSYGDKNKGKPILSFYKIVNSKQSQEKEEDNIYKIDLTNIDNFIGVRDDISEESTRIGFLETKHKTKYYNLKSTLSELNVLQCSKKFFFRTNGLTPYEELGELKLAQKIKILIISSNMKIENLHFKDLEDMPSLVRIK